MPRPLALALATLVLGLGACGDDAEVAAIPTGDEPATTSSTPATPTAPETPEAPAQGDGNCAPKQEESAGRELPCPTPTLAEGRDNVVTFTTSQGAFEVTLDAERAPETANSVAYLADKGFYDDTVFHRVVPDFVIQGGDPLGDTENAGTGGPGYSVTEPPPSDQTYTRGVVAMAKGGPDAPGASGSQFFVVSAPDVGLPPEYALVGKVTKGLGTVDKITALGEGDGPPRTEVRLEKATLSAR